MSTYHYSYPVRLSEQQRRWLEAMVQSSKTPAKHYLVARVLLMSDQSQGGPSHTDGQIAETLEINRRTVIRIKKRFVLENKDRLEPFHLRGTSRCTSRGSIISQTSFPSRGSSLLYTFHQFSPLDRTLTFCTVT